MILTTSLGFATCGGCATDGSESILVGSANPPVNTVSCDSTDVGNFAGAGTTGEAVVPPNYYYELTAVSASSSGSITHFFESTLDGLSSATFSDVTASRSLSTVFHNTTANVVWVHFCGAQTTTNTFSAYSDSSSSPTTKVEERTNRSGFSTPLMFPVLPGYYYKIVASGTASMTKWFEVSTSGPTGMTQNVVTGSRSFGSGATVPSYQSVSGATLVAASLTTGTVQGAGSTFSLLNNTSSLSSIFQQTTRRFSEIADVFVVVPASDWYGASVDSPNSATTILDEWIEWFIPSTTGATVRHRSQWIDQF